MEAIARYPSIFGTEFRPTQHQFRIEAQYTLSLPIAVTLALGLVFGTERGSMLGVVLGL